MHIQGGVEEEKKIAKGQAPREAVLGANTQHRGHYERVAHLNGRVVPEEKIHESLNQSADGHEQSERKNTCMGPQLMPPGRQITAHITRSFPA